MKKIISLLLILIILCSALNFSAFAQTENNILRTGLSSAQGVLMYIANGNVSYDARFDSKGALSKVCDGDTVNHADVYGALDWNPPRYVGVLFTLDGIYDIDRVQIYSGFANMPDTYRVYASDEIDTLYSSDSLIADSVVCSNSMATVSVLKEVKYIAVFCTNYVGNQRIKEIEAWGSISETDPETPSEDDKEMGLRVVGREIYIGNRKMELRGVNIPQFSWSSYGDGNTAAGKSSADIALAQAIGDWECSIVRLAVDPKIYVHGGIGSGTGQTVSKTAEEYRALIDRFVTTLTNSDIVVVLDCHAYSGVYEDVVNFWDIAAPLYNNNELVIYGLLNEPISNWTVWYEGGEVTLPDGTGKNSIGIPALLDRVRAVSDNIVAVGGIDWAFDLSGIADNKFMELASSRASSLGMTVNEYADMYSLKKESRRGRGIILDTHIYSGKPTNWYNAIGEAAKEYPILVGEYNPYFRNGIINELNPQENAFLQKIFHWITVNGFSSTSWSLGAEPFLTDHSGNITAIGEAVRSFIKTGVWECSQDENLIYQHYYSARAIYQAADSNAVKYNNNMFINQAHLNGQKVGNSIITALIDGETSTHYDIYPWDGYYMGLEYQLDGEYACDEIRMTSGINGYTDKYKIYASENLSDLYSEDNIIENFTVEHNGTHVYKIDRNIRYVAFLASGYVRIKEFSVGGVHSGDINADNKINSLDLTALKKHLIEKESVEYSMRCDANGDGKINILDLIDMKKEFAQ